MYGERNDKMVFRPVLTILGFKFKDLKSAFKREEFRKRLMQ